MKIKYLIMTTTLFAAFSCARTNYDHAKLATTPAPSENTVTQTEDKVPQTLSVQDLQTFELAEGDTKSFALLMSEAAVDDRDYTWTIIPQEQFADVDAKTRFKATEGQAFIKKEEIALNIEVAAQAIDDLTQGDQLFILQLKDNKTAALTFAYIKLVDKTVKIEEPKVLPKPEVKTEEPQVLPEPEVKVEKKKKTTTD